MMKLESELTSKLDIHNMEGTISESNEVVQVYFGKVQLFLLSLSYKHIELYFDILKANIVDRDIRSDLSFRKQLGFTEILNCDKLEYLEFIRQAAPEMVTDQ
jgi:hypothetical protein